MAYAKRNSKYRGTVDTESQRNSGYRATVDTESGRNGGGHSGTLDINKQCSEWAQSQIGTVALVQRNSRPNVAEEQWA